ncbi:MAG: ankyrin repeat domain-containing protein [Gemmatimonadaceae bacterium]|nr:ankyrin repeat domain-containing protein [Gemmatimonadaceae bacterium]
MSTLAQEFVEACEGHSVARLRAVLDAGFDVRAPLDGLSPVMTLVEMYHRSDHFPACLRLLLEAGGELDDPRIAPVLLNDPIRLQAVLATDPTAVHWRTSLRCAFTPLDGATLLHVAAEYGHLAAAEVLLAHGADVDARAAVDRDGLNGQTPLFHTVNAYANRSAPLMRLLLAHGARTDVRVPGITWGRGFPWATICFDVTPIGYAQLGALPQFQRDDVALAANVQAMLTAAGRPVPTEWNVPNRYLRGA